MRLVMVSYVRDLLMKSYHCQLQKNVPLQSMRWSFATLLGVVICSLTDFGFLFVLTCAGNFSLICFKAWSEVIGTLQSCSDWPKKGTNLVHTKPRKDFWGKLSYEVSILIYFLVKLVSLLVRTLHYLFPNRFSPIETAVASTVCVNLILREYLRHSYIYFFKFIMLIRHLHISHSAPYLPPKFS